MKPDEGHGDAMGRIARTAPSTANLPQAEEGQLDEQAEKDGVKQVAGKKYSPKDVLVGREALPRC